MFGAELRVLDTSLNDALGRGLGSLLLLFNNHLILVLSDYQQPPLRAPVNQTDTRLGASRKLCLLLDKIGLPNWGLLAPPRGATRDYPRRLGLDIIHHPLDLIRHGERRGDDFFLV